MSDSHRRRNGKAPKKSDEENDSDDNQSPRKRPSNASDEEEESSPRKRLRGSSEVDEGAAALGARSQSPPSSSTASTRSSGSESAVSTADRWFKWSFPPELFISGSDNRGQNDEETVQPPTAPSVSDEEQRRGDDILRINFAYRLIRLIRVIKSHFWFRQCLIAFSPLSQTTERNYLRGESMSLYIAALTEIKTVLSDDSFLRNLTLLHQTPQTLSLVLQRFRTILSFFNNAVTKSVFVYGYDVKGAYGPRQKKKGTLVQRVPVHTLLNSDSFVGTYEVMDDLYAILTNDFPDVRQRRTQTLITRLERLITSAEFRLKVIRPYLIFTSKLPEMEISRPETQSILKSSVDRREKQTKKVNIGAVHHRYDLYEDEMPVEQMDLYFDSIERYQQRRQQEREIRDEIERLREAEAQRNAEIAKFMGKQPVPFRPLQFTHEPKREVPKSPEVSELTMDFPNPRTVLRLTSPPPSPPPSPHPSPPPSPPPDAPEDNPDDVNEDELEGQEENENHNIVGQCQRFFPDMWGYQTPISHRSNYWRHYVY